MLDKKTIHELRGIAQSFGVNDIFEKDANQLRQEIELKQQAIVTPPAKLPEPPKYDARLMTEEPNQQASPEAIVELLEPYIKMGLYVKLSEERWNMSFGLKNDEGTMRMPITQVLRCARKLMA